MRGGYTVPHLEVTLKARGRRGRRVKFARILHIGILLEFEILYAATRE
jgi:hypothetical protein